MTVHETRGGVSSFVAQRAGQLTQLVHNVADFYHFATAILPGELPAELAEIRPLRAMFTGSLRPQGGLAAPISCDTRAV